MKAMAGALGAVVGLLLVGLAAYLALGRKPPPVPMHPAASEVDRGLPGQPGAGGPIVAPASREEQLRDERGKKRLPFYRYLRQNYGEVGERFSVLEDFD